MFCPACGRPVRDHARFCGQCGRPMPAAPAVRPAIPNPPAPPSASAAPARPPAAPPAARPSSPAAAPARPTVSPPPPAVPVPSVPVRPPAPAAGPAGPPPSAGRRHGTGLALAAGIVIPGAGQAYNGQPWKGLLILLFSPLIVPYLFGIYDAHRVARRIAGAGGRPGRGGPAWIVLQGWLAVNLLLLGVLVLTLTGVLA